MIDLYEGVQSSPSFPPSKARLHLDMPPLAEARPGDLFLGQAIGQVVYLPTGGVQLVLVSGADWHFPNPRHHYVTRRPA